MEEMDIAQLIIRLGIAEGDVDRLENRLDEVNAKLAQGGQRAGQAWSGGFGGPLMEAYWSIQNLINGTQQLTQALGAITGVDIAAQYQQLQIGLETLTGSKEAADGLLKSLQQMGATTPFNTEQLVGYSRMLLATGVNAKDVVKDLGTMTDAVAALGLGTEAVGRLSINLAQIRAGHARMTDFNQFAYLGLSLDKIVGAATGKDQTGKGIQTLQAMKGLQQYQTILEGIDRLYGGTATRAGGTYLGVLQNLGETLQNAVLPTGRLLLPLLTAIASAMMTLAGWVKRLNELTGGSLGLIVLFGLLYRAKNLLIGAAIMATSRIQQLSAAISGLAVSASVSRFPAAGAAATAGEGAAAGAGGAALIAMFRSGAWLRAIGPWLRGLLTVARVANIGSLAASLGLGFAGSRIGGHTGGVLSDASTGLGLGGLVGSRFGVWGTLIGSLIGGLGGGIFGALQKDDKSAPAQSDQVKALNDNTAALKDVKGNLVGGGSRARVATSQIALEMGLARMLS